MNRRGPTRFLDVHTFTVDASWGYLYGEDAAGVQRRELVYDKALESGGTSSTGKEE
jgi:hypothetical protein